MTPKTDKMRTKRQRHAPRLRRERLNGSFTEKSETVELKVWFRGPPRLLLEERKKNPGIRRGEGSRGKTPAPKEAKPYAPVPEYEGMDEREVCTIGQPLESLWLRIAQATLTYLTQLILILSTQERGSKYRVGPLKQGMSSRLPVPVQEKSKPLSEERDPPSEQESSTAERSSAISLSISAKTPPSELEGSMQAMQAQFMPWRGGPNSGVPYFEGYNVTEFLRSFDEFCDDFGVKAETRPTRVIRYCASQIGMYLRTTEEFVARSWEDMKKMMLKEWEETDDEQRMRSIAFLEELSRGKRTRSDDIKGYCYQFKIAADALIETEQMTPYQAGILFLRGLPESLQRKVMLDKRVDVTTPSTVRFLELHKHTMSLWKSQEGIEALRKMPEREQVEELVESMKTKPVVQAEKRLAFQESIAPTNQSVSMGDGKQASAPIPHAEYPPKVPRAYRDGPLPKDYEKDLVEMLEKKLVLPIHTSLAQLQNRIAELSQKEGQTEKGQGQYQGGQAGSRPVSCYFCNGPHYRPQCPLLRRRIEAGEIHLNNQQRICLGPYQDGAHEVSFPRNGVTGDEYIRSLLEGGKTGMKVSSISLGIRYKDDEERDAELALDTDEEYGEHLIGVTATRAANKGKAKESK